MNMAEITLFVGGIAGLALGYVAGRFEGMHHDAVKADVANVTARVSALEQDAKAASSVASKAADAVSRGKL